MFCQSDCKLNAQNVCLQCDQIYCIAHGGEHFKEFGHAVQWGHEEMISRIYHNGMKKALNIEKYKQIHQITHNTCSAIANLEQISQMQINSIKEIANISDFSVVNFDFEKHLLYLAQSGMIQKGIYSISNENIVELTSSSNQNLERIKNLQDHIKELDVATGKLKEELSRKIEAEKNQGTS